MREEVAEFEENVRARTSFGIRITERCVGGFVFFGEENDGNATALCIPFELIDDRVAFGTLFMEDDAGEPQRVLEIVLRGKLELSVPTMDDKDIVRCRRLRLQHDDLLDEGSPRLHAGGGCSEHLLDVAYSVRMVEITR